jgi:Condensation domain
VPGTISAPLTFGQLAVWRDIESMPLHSRQDSNAVLTWPIADGCSRGQVRQALDGLAIRHEALRTVYECSSGDRPVQVVHDASSVSPLELSVPQDVAEGNGLVESVEQEITAIEDQPFDLAVEYSWRPVVLTSRGEPRAVVVVVSTIAADPWAGEVLQADFARLLSGGDPGPANTPREVAAWQHSDQWRARTEAAIQYWDGLLAALQADDSPQPAYRNRPEVAVKAQLLSRPAGEATRQLASRLRASVPSIVLAAYALATSTVLGIPRVLVNVMSANRFWPVTEELVCSMSQWVPLLVGPRPREAFVDLAARTYWLAVRAYRHGCYDPDLFARHWSLDPRLGEGGWPGVFFNFIPGDPAEDAEDEAAVTSRPVFAWQTPMVRTGPSFYLRACEGTELSLTARAMWDGFPAAHLEQVMRSMHDILVTAAGS